MTRDTRETADADSIETETDTGSATGGDDSLSGRDGTPVGSLVGDASRRDFLKASAGASALAAGIGTGLVGSASAQVIQTPQLHVDGNLIKDPDGATVKLRGVNMADPKRIDVTAPARGKTATQVVDLLTDTSQDWYSRAIRIPVQPVDIGEHQPGEGPPPVAFTESQLQTYMETHLDPVIDRCLQRGAYAIIDYHRHRDVSWTNETLAEEVQMFWDTVAPRYADRPHVMYELYNEPTEPGMWGDPTQQQNWADTWRDWKSTAQPWVDTIRSHAPDNLVLIGSPSWSQSPEGALVEPFDGSNLAYTFHIYPGHNSSTSQNWEDASSSNNGEGVAGVYEEYPLFVTEFGWEQGGGQYIGGTDDFGTAFLDFLEKSDAIHWTAWIGDPVWRPVMFERSFGEGEFADNIGNPYEESVPEECASLPCEWSVTTGSGAMGDDIKQALIDHRNDNAPTVAYDQQAPSAPTGLSTSNVTETTADISWNGVTDSGEAGMSHYAVTVDGETVAEVAAGTTSTTVTGLQADTAVTIGVTAVDRARNESAAATTQVTTDAFDDSTAPSAPTNLSWPQLSHESITASWDPSTDAGDAETAGLSHYNVYLDGSLEREVPEGTTQARLTGLDADTTYEVGVSAVDRAGNESGQTTAQVTTDLATAGEEDLVVNDFDGDPPWPENNDLGNWCGSGSFESIGVENGALQIDYNASGWYGTGISQDITGYPTLKFNVSGETGGEEAGIEFSLGGVSAMLGDVADGSIGTSETILSVDLDAAGVDLQSPGQLQLQFYNAGDGSITIDEIWLEAAGSGDPGDGDQGDTSAPSAPTTLQATSVGETSVGVTWSGSSDAGGSGLSHYAVSVGGTTDQQVSAGTTTATVTGLSPGTSYEISVAAVDGAGNRSGSATVSVTTTETSGDTGTGGSDGGSAGSGSGGSGSGGSDSGGSGTGDSGGSGTSGSGDGGSDSSGSGGWWGSGTSGSSGGSGSSGSSGGSGWWGSSGSGSSSSGSGSDSSGWW